MTNEEYLKKYGKLTSENLQKLNNGEPIQYIVGNVDFYGNLINVDKRVLIPRFETEELVSKTIDYINQYFDKPVTIADIGTGSGCIAITLKKEIEKANVIAIDISNDALDLAKINAENNNVNIKFLNGNLLDPLDEKVDILISNPPYIAYDDTEIMDVVKNYEPHLALFALDNGLHFYKEILRTAKEKLNNKSIIAFEIGYKQAKDIQNFAKKYFENSTIIIEKDLQNKDRFIFILNNCE